MSGMKADEEDFEVAGEAKETKEERHKKTKDNQMIIVETANTRTTATFVSEVPCCSQCRKQFPVNEWIAVYRCPIAEAHAERECNAKLLHRHCVQAHYAMCHPQDECPEKYKQFKQEQIQRQEHDDELQKVEAEVQTPQMPDLDIAQCSHCMVFYQKDPRIQVSMCPIRQSHGPQYCKADMMHRFCVHPHYEECHPGRDCPEEFRLPTRLRLHHVATSSASSSCTSRIKERPLRCDCKCKCKKRSRGYMVCSNCDRTVCEGTCFREYPNVCHMCPF